MRKNTGMHAVQYWRSTSWLEGEPNILCHPSDIEVGENTPCSSICCNKNGRNLVQPSLKARSRWRLCVFPWFLSRRCTSVRFSLPAKKKKRPRGPSPSASPSDGEIFKWCCASSALTQILTAMRKSKSLMNFKRKRKALFKELDFLLLYKILNVWYKACLYLRARDFFPFLCKREELSSTVI